MAQQSLIEDFEIGEMDDLQFISEFAELTKLCGIFADGVMVTGEANILKPADPAKPTLLRLTTTSAPPTRYVRRNKTQVKKADRDLAVFDLSF
jgi:hypothetical protein